MDQAQLLNFEGVYSGENEQSGQGINKEDLRRLYSLSYSGNFDIKDYTYFSSKYPELMGVWATIAKTALKTGAGAIKAIAAAVRKKRDKKKQSKLSKTVSNVSSVVSQVRSAPGEDLTKPENYQPVIDQAISKAKKITGKKQVAVQMVPEKTDFKKFLIPGAVGVAALVLILALKK